MTTKILTAALLMSSALAIAGSATAGVAPGQYQIGGIQQICLARGGTWYGTTYHFNGHWANQPRGSEDLAALYGNYQSGGPYYGFYNDTITIEKTGGADWYDYNGDDSYHFFGGGVSFVFVKTVCDPPAAMHNTHAATQ